MLVSIVSVSGVPWYGEGKMLKDSSTPYINWDMGHPVVDSKLFFRS